MCHSRGRSMCGGCCHGISRRDFVKGLGAAVGTAGGLAAAPSLAGEPKARPVRVGLVYLSKEGSSWPHPKFDVHRREQEILRLLKEGCPGVEFVPVAVRNPGDVQEAVALQDRVDGYLIYCLTLTWNLTAAIGTVGKLGKPTVVADEYLGGSGMFMVGYSGLCRQGVPTVGVAATRPGDLVAVAGQFADRVEVPRRPRLADRHGRVPPAVQEVPVPDRRPRPGRSGAGFPGCQRNLRRVR
ncbi:MAG: twin-arginine translocation signal domain-containing protein [Planctomycetota bacterium]